jgi:hypothetical protein
MFRDNDLVHAVIDRHADTLAAKLIGMRPTIVSSR